MPRHFLPGDYNHDDRVDAADYVVWRDTLGSATELVADGSGNLLVDAADYDVWRTNFGSLFGESPAAGAGSPTAIPEPSGTAIITSGIFVTLARARKRETTAKLE